MRKNTVLVPIIVLLMLFAGSLGLIVVASAQTRTVGVSVGNKFRYGGTVNWSSSDPSATPPSYILDSNDTEWWELTVTAISGVNITGRTLRHYKNGTETTTDAWADVNTGNGELVGLIISANLAVGNSVYTSSPFNTWIINETAPRTYLSSVRDTNHLNQTSSPGPQSYRTNSYWDKSTGIVVEALQDTTNVYGPANAYTTTWSTHTQIISSNVWTVIPEFPNWSLALFILMALTATTMVVAKQRQLKRPFR